jgi:hypothetical protein
VRHAHLRARLGVAAAAAGAHGRMHARTASEKVSKPGVEARNARREGMQV